MREGGAAGDSEHGGANLPGSGVSNVDAGGPETSADSGMGNDASVADALRTRLLITDAWRFTKGDPPQNTTSLLYDLLMPAGGAAGADAAPDVVKSWILPTGNRFLKDQTKATKRPAGNLAAGVAYVAASFDDSSWQSVHLPHDYAIQGPFTSEVANTVAALPAPGVVWYRKKLSVPSSDAGKTISLDVDGAMSYSMVWLNGNFVGGWPYGYASFRLDLTPYVKPGEDNVLAIRLDNPVAKDTNWQSASSRWYPGGGLYRNIWLVKTSAVHVGHWGTYVTTPEVSGASARVDLRITVDNDSAQDATVSASTQIFELDRDDHKSEAAVASIPPVNVPIPARGSATANTSGTVANPKLWGTGLHQKPNRYVAVTTVQQGDRIVDVYETPFGIRTLKFDPNAGFSLNGEHIPLNGVCNHHDLGALGAAVHERALQRQMETLQEMGTNAIRTAHNPPAPEFLDWADKMGFLVMDESFDVWAKAKTELDYHLLFADWHEQDMRAMLRRDRNHPSVIMWSVGNEVNEQNMDPEGGTIGSALTAISHEEDPTRPTVAGMNNAKPTSPMPAAIDAVGLNYQGSGIRQDPPQYPVYHEAFPGKFIVGSETASVLSSRGVYTFPVAAGYGVGITGRGVDPSFMEGRDAANQQVSSYDLYFPSYAGTPDKEFASLEANPFVGGQFVWTGWDYLGEPTPIDAARSSYYGAIDLAGFKKDLFYLLQSYWRAEYPMAHILPHWTWPERVGLVTPVHVFTSGDEAELFLNGMSLGRKKKGPGEYRLRWDDVAYQPGELGVVAYKNGQQWATDSVMTAGDAKKLTLTPDRTTIASDGKDLSFVTLTVSDENHLMVPRAMNLVHFEVSGPGEIVATDNGDPTDRTAFPSRDRKAFHGLALAIVRAQPGQKGEVVVVAKSDGLAEARTTVVTR